MAHPWFRLWSDMVNDPKWRTIARTSDQSISNVIAVALHMMTTASNAEQRGWLEGFEDEDVASALDIPVQHVTAIRDAMQGRFLDGDRLMGWDKRQPKREDDTAAERKRDSRARHTVSHIVTTDKSRKDKSKEKLTPPPGGGGDDQPPPPDCPHQEIIALYHEILPLSPKVRAWTAERASLLQKRWRSEAKRQDLDYWRDFFEYVATCDLLMGRKPGTNGRRPFRADLPWMLEEDHFVKIIEHKYEDA